MTGVIVTEVERSVAKMQQGQQLPPNLTDQNWNVTLLFQMPNSEKNATGVNVLMEKLVALKRRVAMIIRLQKVNPIAWEKPNGKLMRVLGVNVSPMAH